METCQASRSGPSVISTLLYPDMIRHVSGSLSGEAIGAAEEAPWGRGDATRGLEISGVAVRGEPHGRHRRGGCTAATHTGIGVPQQRVSLLSTDVPSGETGIGDTQPRFSLTSLVWVIKQTLEIRDMKEEQDNHHQVRYTMIYHTVGGYRGAARCSTHWNDSVDKAWLSDETIPVLRLMLKLLSSYWWRDSLSILMLTCDDILEYCTIVVNDYIYLYHAQDLWGP